MACKRSGSSGIIPIPTSSLLSTNICSPISPLFSIFQILISHIFAHNPTIGVGPGGAGANRAAGWEQGLGGSLSQRGGGHPAVQGAEGPGAGEEEEGGLLADGQAVRGSLEEEGGERWHGGTSVHPTAFLQPLCLFSSPAAPRAGGAIRPLRLRRRLGLRLLRLLLRLQRRTLCLRPLMPLRCVSGVEQVAWMLL